MAKKKCRIAIIKQEFNRETGSYKYVRAMPAQHILSKQFETRSLAKRMLREHGIPNVEYEIFVVEIP